jgi:hypothetical protein
MQWKQEPYRLGRGGYVSEFGQFLKDYQAGHPNMERDQQRGWYIYWDHKVDFDELERERQDHVPVPPYYYYE